MQFSIRNLCYAVWLQRNHVGSLRSGVEPFILCAEFSSVDVSKIAVVATLTVNLLHPCNVSLSRRSFSFGSQGPAFGDKLSGLIEGSRQEGKSLFSFLLGWEGSYLSLAGRRALLALQGRSSLAFRAELWSVAGRRATKCWEWRCLSVDGGFPCPGALLPGGQGTGVNGTEITRFFLCTHSWDLLHGERGEWSFPWGVWYLTLRKLGHRDGAWPLRQVVCALREECFRGRVCVAFSL